MAATPVLITGLGTINAIARNTSDFAAGLQAGKCGIGPLTLFDPSDFHTATAAQINDWTPGADLPRALRGRRMSRADRLAMTATLEALTNAGLWPLPESLRLQTGVSMGCGAGGMLEAEAVFRRHLAGDASKLPFSVFGAFSGASTADQIASALDLNGPKASFMTACTSASVAIAHARDMIAAGLSEVMIAGGTEAMSRMTYGVFNALKAIDSEFCRPFDRTRRGLSLGEGAGILILESAAHAQRRGARIYGAVLGVGLSCDAGHITAPDATGAGAAAAMQAALHDACISPDRIDTISAHGTATSANDAMETRAIKTVFGHRAAYIPISAIKSMTGHTLAAAGALAAVACILSLEQGFIPPTIHCSHPDPACDLDYVTDGARRQALQSVLSNSFAFGGNNVCLVFGASDGIEVACD